MTVNHPKVELQQIEQHRAEAQRYLPKTDEQYQAGIDAGTDPYTSDWLEVACWAGALGTLSIVVAQLVHLFTGFDVAAFIAGWF